MGTERNNGESGIILLAIHSGHPIPFSNHSAWRHLSLLNLDLATLNLEGLPVHQIPFSFQEKMIFLFFALPESSILPASKRKIPFLLSQKRDLVRSEPDLNWCRSFCRALPNRSAIRPLGVRIYNLFAYDNTHTFYLSGDRRIEFCHFNFNFFGFRELLLQLVKYPLGYMLN